MSKNKRGNMLTLFLILINYLCITSGGIVSSPTEGKLDWWQNAIIYEIFPQSFKDSNADGTGDFNGITEKLDYLVDIGVSAIWLTPFLESPLKSGGYDISDYQNVQKVFGSMDEFKNLINTAHKKNIKVIMDFVPNHTSDEHEWFKSSVKNETEYSDYYIWKDAKNIDEWKKNNTVTPIEPNNWQRICGEENDSSAWMWHETRQQFYFSQFIRNLPDLNFRNAKVHEEMKKVLEFWLDFGLDGIRIDALKHVYESEKLEDEPIKNASLPLDYHNMRHYYTVDLDETYDLIKEWRLLLDGFKQKDNNTRIIMTESYSANEILFEYYKSGAEIPTNFGFMPYHQTFTPKQFDRVLYSWITGMPDGATHNVVLQNHDHRRISSKYGDGLIDGMNALSLFLPGVAIVYYGGEIGMQDISDGTNYARSPMQWNNTKNAGFTDGDTPWIAVHQNYTKRNVESEYDDPKSHLNFFKSVSSLRQTETLKRGGLATYVFSDNVFVINRFLPGKENYTLIINMDSNTQNIRLSDQIPNLHGSLGVVLGSAGSDFTAGNVISTESLTLKPGATIVLGDKTTGSATTSSSTRLFVTFEILLLCVCFIKMFGR